MMQMDSRRRAMLEYMGIPMKWLRQPAQPAAAPIALPAAQPVSGSHRSPAGTAIPSAIARSAPAAGSDAFRQAEQQTEQQVAEEPAWHTLDWSALQQQCARLYPAPTAQGCIWGSHTAATVPVLTVPVMVVMDADYTMQLQQGTGAQSPALRLLQNMLAALDWQLHDVCISSWQRGSQASGLAAAPSEQDAVRYDRILQRQAQLLNCKALLLLDPQAQQRFADSSSDGLHGLRQWLELPAVGTYHPSQLLRRPADKARAWEILCQLAEALPAL